MFKRILKAILYGAAFEAGVTAFRKMKDPVSRANIKHKFKKIRDIVTDKHN